jgi:hypothetical protein
MICIPKLALEIRDILLLALLLLPRLDNNPSGKEDTIILHWVIFNSMSDLNMVSEYNQWAYIKFVNILINDTESIKQ